MPLENTTIDNSITDNFSHESAIIENGSSTISENKSIDDERPNSNTQGLTDLEKRDPNSINVTIADKDAPLIVLFGPPTSGKTMTLIRLTRFIHDLGQEYTVNPIPSFRPSSDSNYAEICATFNTMINNNNASKSTDRISFMLVEILKHGRRLCQVLEAPGEFYFNPKEPNASFPNYVNKIIASNNRKIWTIIVEPNWLDEEDRRNYVTRIKYLKSRMRAKDKVVFLFNKIDKTPYVRKVGDINILSAITEVENMYPNIFNPFMNLNPISKLWKKYNCNFVPFQTGTYTKAINGDTFQEGPKEYCEHFWKVLLTRIKG
jgi:hypothetical protein